MPKKILRSVINYFGGYQKNDQLILNYYANQTVYDNALNPDIRDDITRAYFSALFSTYRSTNRYNPNFTEISARIALHLLTESLPPRNKNEIDNQVLIQHMENAIVRLRKERSNGNAFTCLGICYKKGWGVTQNIYKAAELFQQGVNREDPAAKYHLATMILEAIFKKSFCSGLETTDSLGACLKINDFVTISGKPKLDDQNELFLHAIKLLGSAAHHLWSQPCHELAALCEYQVLDFDTVTNFLYRFLHEDGLSFNDFSLIKTVLLDCYKMTLAWNLSYFEDGMPDNDLKPVILKSLAENERQTLLNDQQLLQRLEVNKKGNKDIVETRLLNFLQFQYELDGFITQIKNKLRELTQSADFAAARKIDESSAWHIPLFGISSTFYKIDHFIEQLFSASNEEVFRLIDQILTIILPKLAKPTHTPAANNPTYAVYKALESLFTHLDIKAQSHLPNYPPPSYREHQVKCYG